MNILYIKPCRKNIVTAVLRESVITSISFIRKRRERMQNNKLNNSFGFSLATHNSESWYFTMIKTYFVLTITDSWEPVTP